MNTVEANLTTSEIEALCALNGVTARKAACMLANPLNLYAIDAMERVRGNRVILLEAVAGRLRKLGHPAEPPVVEPVPEPKAARKPRVFAPKDDKEPIVTQMLRFECPAPEPATGFTSERPCPKCKGIESTGTVFGYRAMKHTLKSGEVRIVTRRQSRCNKCRGGYVKAKAKA